MRFGTLRMPLDQTALFNFTSTRTSDVFIIFCAKVLICLFIIIAEEERRERARFRERDAEVNEKKSEKKQPRLSLFGVIGNFCLSRGPTYELKKTNAKRDEEQRRGRNQHTREHKYTPRAFPPPIPRRVFRETHPASRISDPIFRLSLLKNWATKALWDQKQRRILVQKKRRKSRPNDTYRLHRARSSLLKSNSVSRFAQVDGIFSRYDVVGTHFCMCYVR